MPPQIHPIQADLGDPESLKNLPVNLNFIFYTAGADSPSEASYQAAYLVGLKNLLDLLAAEEKNICRFFLTSSTSVYGNTSEEWVDEESPTDAENYRGRIMREAEEMALGAPFPVTAVRMGGIYGPGRERLIESVRSGGPEIKKMPSRYINRIHRDDCSGIFCFLMKIDKTKNGAVPDALYNGVDSEPTSNSEVVRWLAGKMGTPAPTEAADATTPEGRSRYGTGKRCSNARIRAVGYEFLYPTFRDGYAAILDNESG